MCEIKRSIAKWQSETASANKSQARIGFFKKSSILHPDGSDVRLVGIPGLQIIGVDMFTVACDADVGNGVRLPGSHHLKKARKHPTPLKMRQARRPGTRACNIPISSIASFCAHYQLRRVTRKSLKFYNLVTPAWSMICLNIPTSLITRAHAASA